MDDPTTKVGIAHQNSHRDLIHATGTSFQHVSLFADLEDYESLIRAVGMNVGVYEFDMSGHEHQTGTHA